VSVDRFTVCLDWFLDEILSLVHGTFTPSNARQLATGGFHQTSELKRGRSTRWPDRGWWRILPQSCLEMVRCRVMSVRCRNIRAQRADQCGVCPLFAFDDRQTSFCLSVATLWLTKANSFSMRKSQPLQALGKYSKRAGTCHHHTSHTSPNWNSRCRITSRT
jgi:hypothetical protein